MLALREALAEAGAAGRGRPDRGERRAPGRHAAQSHLGPRAAAARAEPGLTAGSRSAGCESVQEQIGKVADAVRGLLEHVRRSGTGRRRSIWARCSSRSAMLVRPRLTACGVRLERGRGRWPAAGPRRRRRTGDGAAESREQRHRRDALRRRPAQFGASLDRRGRPASSSPTRDQAFRRTCCPASSSRGSRPRRQGGAPGSA